MKIAIIIPAHNRIDLFLETLSSVAAQTLEEIEIVVTDDSEDFYRDLIEYTCKKSDRIHYVFTKSNLGQAANTNQGLRYALKNCKAPYFKILHSDDVLHPMCLQKEFEILEFLGGELLYHDNLPFERTPKLTSKVMCYLEDPVYLIRKWLNVATAVPSTVTFHRDLLKNGKILMNEKYKFLCDWELFFDIVIDQHEKNKMIAHVKPGLVGWRFNHLDSTTYIHFEDHFREHVEMIEKYASKPEVAKHFSPAEMVQWKNDGKIYRDKRYENDKKSQSV